MYKNTLNLQLSPECVYLSLRDTCYTLNLQLVDVIFRHHLLAAEVGHHLCPAAGAEADR